MPHLFTFLPVKMSLAVASSEKQRLALAGLTPHQAFVLIATVGTACFVLWAALQQLRQQLFTAQEQLRIDAALALRAVQPTAPGS